MENWIDKIDYIHIPFIMYGIITLMGLILVDGRTKREVLEKVLFVLGWPIVLVACFFEWIIASVVLWVKMPDE